MDETEAEKRLMRFYELYLIATKDKSVEEYEKILEELSGRYAIRLEIPAKSLVKFCGIIQ